MTQLPNLEELAKKHPHSEYFDLREHPRLRCKGAAEMRFLELDSKVSGTLIDLSVSGCCVETNSELPKIELPVVEVLLTVDGFRLCVKGVVRNEHQFNRAGIEFVDVTPRKAKQIVELVNEIIEQWAENSGSSDCISGDGPAAAAALDKSRS